MTTRHRMRKCFANQTSISKPTFCFGDGKEELTFQASLWVLTPSARGQQMHTMATQAAWLRGPQGPHLTFAQLQEIRRCNAGRSQSLREIEAAPESFFKTGLVCPLIRGLQLKYFIFQRKDFRGHHSTFQEFRLETPN